MELLSSTDAPVIGWDRRDFDLLERDVVRAAVLELQPSAIYHCAGAPHVAHSWEDTFRPLASNVLATHHLLDAVRRAGIACRVLIPGSSTVYQSSADTLTEAHPVAPTSPYALSKLAQEQLGARAVVEDGIEVILTRSFNHTGPRQRASFAAPSIARQMAMIEAGRAEPVLRVGNLDARRDVMDVRDTVRAYHLLMQSGRPGVPYNVCTGTAHAIGDLLEGLRRRIKVPVRVEVAPELLRPSDTPIVLGDPTLLRSETGWSPEIPFDRMLDDLLNYWREAVQREPA